MDTFTAAWTWLGNEIAAFGVRWLVVGIAMFGFGGWFGWRYREMKRDNAAMKADIADLKRQVQSHQPPSPLPTVPAPQPVNVRQEVHVHGSEPKREVKTVGGTLLDALLALPSRPRTETDRVRERMEEAARQLPEDDDESPRNS